MKRQDAIFRNSMFLFTVLEAVGIFAHMPVLAEVSVVALMTAGGLWLVFLAGDEDEKQRKRAARRGGTR